MLTGNLSKIIAFISEEGIDIVWIGFLYKINIVIISQERVFLKNGRGCVRINILCHKCLLSCTTLLYSYEVIGKL